MGQAWVANSANFEPVPTEKIHVVYVFNAIAVAILIHSAYENSWKRWPPMRILTDVGIFGTLLACAVLHADKYMDGRAIVFKDADAYLMNLTFYGIANTITQLCHNYFLYLRLVAMDNPHVCVRFLLQAYIWLVLVAPWNAFYTIVPFFVDVNRPDVSIVMEQLKNLTAAGYLLYNIGFVTYFTHKLCKARRAVSSMSGGGAASAASITFTKQVMLNGSKVILYCLISTTGFLLDAYEDKLNIVPVGKLASLLTVNVGMHFLFNVDWETVPSRHGCAKASAIMQSHSTSYKARFAERNAPTHAATRKVQVSDDKVTLEKVLNNLMLRDCFVEYCRSCFCEESVLFLLDVIHFKAEAAKGLTGMQAYLTSAQACEHIVKDYLQPGCPYEINISAGMRDRTVQRSVLYIEACKQAAKPKPANSRLARGRRKSTEAQVIEKTGHESMTELSTASGSGEPRRTSLSTIPTISLNGGQRKSLSQIVSNVVARANGNTTGGSTDAASADAAGAPPNTGRNPDSSLRRSKVGELPVMQGVVEGQSRAMQILQSTTGRLIVAHLMSKTARKRQEAEAQGGDGEQHRRRTFTDAVRSVMGMGRHGNEPIRGSIAVSTSESNAAHHSSAQQEPQPSPQADQPVGSTAASPAASPAALEEGLSASGGGSANSGRDPPASSQSFVPLVPPGGDVEAGLASLPPMSARSMMHSLPNQEFVNPIFTGTLGSGNSTAKRSTGGHTTMELNGTATTGEDRALTTTNEGHERHSSTGSLSSLQAVTPPRSPADLTTALDAPAVFQIAYNEVAKVLGENLLGGFKSSTSYQQVMALKVGNEEAGAIMSGAVLR